MRDFYDQVLAETLAGKRQTGIADMLVQQLSGGIDGTAPAPAALGLASGGQGGQHALRGTWQRGVEALDSAWAAGKAGFRALVDSVIKHESSGNIAAVSPKGARGLMQLMPGTGQTERGRRRRCAVETAGELLHQHVGNPGLALSGQGFGEHLVVEVAHGVQLATAHRIAGREHVAGLAHLLEDLLQEHGLELLGNHLQLLAARGARAVMARAHGIEVVR
jgi:hypothetical protein